MKQVTTTLCCLLFSFLFLSLSAQTVQLRGKIVDSATEQPVMSATISSGNQTVLSDAQGNFAIKADKGKPITASFVGYSPRTMTVSDDGPLTIILSQSTQQLNDVVVTALGV